MLDKLKKLRGRSLDEFRFRTGQSVNVLSERLGVSTQSRLPSTESLLAEFPSVEDEADLLEYFRSRSSVRFYQSFSDTSAIVKALKTRFPDEERSILARAESVTDGFFDLLGHNGLRFGGAIPNWHLEPESNQTLPALHWSRIDIESWGRECDLKIVWELNRHQYFTTLGQAYLLTQNEKFAETFVAHLNDWFDKNPPKIGVNWASSLELAFRAISWVWAFHFFKNSPTFTPDVFSTMLKYLYLHGRHLEAYLSTYSSPNTHLTGEALGLYYIGTFLPEISRAAMWKRLGTDVLMKALDFQVRPDGSYCEQSTHYHRYTVDFYANLLILRRLNGEDIKAVHEEKLSKLYDFLLHTSQPNGEMPLIGDDDGGKLAFLDNRPVASVQNAIALGAVILERGDLKYCAGGPSSELLWLLGTGGLEKYDALIEERPNRTAMAFRDGGVFAMRSSWDKDPTHIIIDCGEHGFLKGGHAHADALSFVLSFDGQPIFIDSGTFKYASAIDDRDYFRSSAAHNCLLVNGESSSVSGGPWDWVTAAHCELLNWEQSGELALLRGTHDGFGRFGVKYEREIAVRPDGIVTLVDSVICERRNHYEFHFILSSSVNADMNSGAITIKGRGQDPADILTIYTEIDAPQPITHQWLAEPCYISSCYGARVESTKLVLSIEADGKFIVRSNFRRAERTTQPNKDAASDPGSTLYNRNSTVLTD